jgi:SAM-dependent methyltransferase
MSESDALEQTAYDPEKFYSLYAKRYSEVAHQYLQSVYIKSSHPNLRGDLDLLNRLVQLAPGKTGLDAGCGAGARDVHYLWSNGFDIRGVDAVQENIAEAKTRHPDIADRVTVADLKLPLDFPSGHFDFVMCNAVIQHIDPESLISTTVPELTRVLKPGGILQLMFKNGIGIISVYDKDYGVDRTFQLYEECKLLDLLGAQECELVPADAPGELGGVMYFTDPKPVDHCVFHVRKAL